MPESNLQTRSEWKPLDYVLLTVVMTLMGGLYWGVRGAGGFGGETGGMLAGAGWGMWWYLASNAGARADARPYGSPWALFAIILGVCVGGFTGYGVYISWLSGVFHYIPGDQGHPIAPAIGFFMLFLCGLHWGGIAGTFLAWCAPARPMTWWLWCIRIACGLGGAALALWWLRAYPQLHLPFYEEGIYNQPDFKDVQRTREQIEPIGQHLGAFAGFLLFEIARRDWRAVGLMLLFAIGFAVPFCAGAIWQTNYDSAWKVSWWKHWEITIGLGGGLTFGLAFWLFNRPGDTLRPVIVNIGERFFNWGGILWLVLFTIIHGSVTGRLNMHHVKLDTTQIIGAFLAGMGVCTLALFWRYRGERVVDLVPGGNLLPLRPFALVQASILTATLLVSVPPQMELANIVVLSAYAVFVGISAACGWWLYQRVGEVETIPYVTPAQRFRM